MNGEIEKLQKILQNDPSNFQARRELSILLANNGFIDEALSNLLFLRKYFEEDAEIHYNIGILYEKIKDFENAKISYEKAIEISPQTDFYYNLGEVLVELKEWEDAISAFKFVLQKDSKDGNCYFNLGVCYLNREELNLATDNFQKAVDLNPKDLFAHFYLGNIYQKNGLTNFAEDSYKKVLEISPDYSWAYFNLASIAFKNENIEQAREYLLKTIEYNENDIDAYKLLTQIQIRENEIENIITLLRTRLEKEENGDLYYILGSVYKYIGQKQDYVLCLAKALRNKLSLTFSREDVKEEFRIVKSIYGLPEDSQGEYEDYDGENFEQKDVVEKEADDSDSGFEADDFEIEDEFDDVEDLSEQEYE